MYGNDRKILLEKGRQLRKIIDAKLHLELKVFDIRSTAFSPQFLGYRLIENRLLLSGRSMKRYKRKLTQYSAIYESGWWDDKTYRNHLIPLVGFAKKADSFNFRQKLMQDRE